jgi:hypothetical protein
MMEMVIVVMMMVDGGGDDVLVTSREGRLERMKNLQSQDKCSIPESREGKGERREQYERGSRTERT